MRLDASLAFGRVWRIASAIAAVGMVAASLDVQARDVERGRQLYENHCQKCHSVKVHGRKDRTPLTLADLREIVNQWQSNQGLRWRDDEIDDVVHYLATSRYFLLTRR